MNICMLPKDLGGVGHYRVIFPSRALRDAGHHTFVPVGRAVEQVNEWTGLPETGVVLSWSTQLLEQADVFVFQIPTSPQHVEAITAAKDAGKTVMVDLDDLYHAIPPGNPAHGLDLTSLDIALELADVVTVSTQPLQDHYSRVHGRVELVRNFLHPDLCFGQERSERPDGRVRFGWPSLSHGYHDNVSVLRGVIGPWLERNESHAAFVAVDDATHDLLGIPEGCRVTTGPRPFHLFGELLAEIDVIVNPIVDSEFNRCKSWVKCLQGAAAGLPFVTSPHAETELLLKSPCGFVADTPQRWRERLDALLDPTLRAAMGGNARKKAETLTINEEGWRWVRAYEQAATAVEAAA